ncbi:lipocalin-like domain-containing protein [Chitinophaga cymbidii]|uniref:Lipocalin-like domain-containing protein n=1 Tax=Chitinophaga cymbidii TaxID=1096750 RepID=A0A512RH96_9BACT|nr:lipocalin family protein [Chitinophaga cymbidii]GEP95068.1 hypothetical protein CCY01nite_13280 [Chitinophaga cymbidii]
MIKPSVIAGLTLILAACQPKQQAAKETDTVQENSQTFPENPGMQEPDSVATLLDTTKTEVDSTLLPGRWMQPVPGIDSILQGMDLRKNGKAVSINMHTLLYDKWKLAHDTLILWSHAEGVENPAPAIDTMLVKTLNDSVLVLFPTSAVPGYLEKFTRQRKGKK